MVKLLEYLDEAEYEKWQEERKRRRQQEAQQQRQGPLTPWQRAMSGAGYEPKEAYPVPEPEPLPQGPPAPELTPWQRAMAQITPDEIRAGRVRSMENPAGPEMDWRPPRPIPEPPRQPEPIPAPEYAAPLEPTPWQRIFSMQPPRAGQQTPTGPQPGMLEGLGQRNEWLRQNLPGYAGSADALGKTFEDLSSEGRGMVLNAGDLANPLGPRFGQAWTNPRAQDEAVKREIEKEGFWTSLLPEGPVRGAAGAAGSMLNKSLLGGDLASDLQLVQMGQMTPQEAKQRQLQRQQELPEEWQKWQHEEVNPAVEAVGEFGINPTNYMFGAEGVAALRAGAKGLKAAPGAIREAGRIAREAAPEVGRTARRLAADETGAILLPGRGRDYPVGKTQQLVLDALGIKATGFSDAERQFEQMGLIVRAKRVGKNTVPEIEVKPRQGGGFTAEGEGAVVQQYPEIDLAPIQQWLGQEHVTAKMGLSVEDVTKGKPTFEDFTKQYAAHERRVKLAEEKPTLISGLKHAKEELDKALAAGKPRVIKQQERAVADLEKRVELNLNGKFADEEQAAFDIRNRLEQRYKKTYPELSPTTPSTAPAPKAAAPAPAAESASVVKGATPDVPASAEAAKAPAFSGVGDAPVIERLLQTPEGEPIAHLRQLSDQGRDMGTYEVVEWLGGDAPMPYGQGQTYRQYFEGRTAPRLIYQRGGEVSREGAPNGYLQLASGDQKFLAPVEPRITAKGGAIEAVEAAQPAPGGPAKGAGTGVEVGVLSDDELLAAAKAVPMEQRATSPIWDEYNKRALWNRPKAPVIEEAAQPDLGGFEATIPTPRQRAKAIEQLNAQHIINGTPTARRAYIEQRVAEGARVETREGQRVLVHPDGSYIRQSELTKTGMDYAEWLSTKGDMSKPASATTPAEAPVASAQTAPNEASRAVEAITGPEGATEVSWPDWRAPRVLPEVEVPKRELPPGWRQQEGGTPELPPPAEPPRPPEPPTNTRAGDTTPEPPAEGQAVPWFKDTYEIEAAINAPGGWFNRLTETVAEQVPGAKRVVGAFDPAAAQQSHLERIPLIFRNLDDTGRNIVRSAMAQLEGIKLEGFTIKNNRFSEGVTVKPQHAGASLALSDVLEHSYRYDMPESLRQFIRTANGINDELVRRAESEGVKLHKMKFEEGGHYFGRLVREVHDVAKRMGVKPDASRVYDAMEAGIQAGIKYEDDLLATAEAGFGWLVRKSVGKRMGKLVQPLGRTPTELIDSALNTAAATKLKTLRTVTQFSTLLSNVKNGMSLYHTAMIQGQPRKVLAASVNKMEAVLPGSKERLIAISKLKPRDRVAPLRALIDEVKQLQAGAASEYKIAKTRRAKAIEQVRNSPEFITEASKFGLRGRGYVAAHPIRQGWASGRLFPRETADYLNNQFGSEGSRLLKGLGSVSDAIRTFKAGFDLGTASINLLPVFAYRPKEWAKAFYYMHAALKDPQTYYSYLSRPENLAVLEKLVPEGLTIEGIEYTTALERGGVLRRVLPKAVSERAEAVFAAPINVGKLEVAKALLPKFEREGQLKELSLFLNNLTGTRSSLAAGIGPWQRGVESTLLFFSPRMTRSALALVGDALQGGLKGGEARKALAGLTVGNALLTAGLANLTGQEITPEMFDPRNPDFMTVRLFDRRVGLGGAHRSLTTLLGQSLKAAQEDPDVFLDVRNRREHPLTRWWTSRAAPVTGLLWDVAEQRDFMGEPLATPEQWLRWGAKQGVPMWLDEAVPYPGEKIENPAGFALDLYGMRATPLTPAMKRDEALDAAAKAKYGRLSSELDADEWAALLKEQPELEALRREVSERYAERGSAYHQYQTRKTAMRDELEGKIKALGEDLRAGRKTGNQYRQAVGELERDIAKLPDTLQDADPTFKQAVDEVRGGQQQEPTSEFDRYLDAYYQISKDLTDPRTGQLDVKELIRQRDALREEYPAEIVKRGDVYLARNRDPEYAKALEQFREYMAIPKYIGFTTEQAERADEIGTYIRERSRQTGSTAKAKLEAMKKDRQGYLLYRRAQDRGTNPKRKRFWQKNEELQRFFSDIVIPDEGLDKAG